MSTTSTITENKCDICGINLPDDGYELCETCYEGSKLARIHYFKLKGREAKANRDYFELIKNGTGPLGNSLVAPPSSKVPHPPSHWITFNTKKYAHKLIHNHPGKYNSEQISKILQNNSQLACDELVKSGYIRLTSGGTFIALKKFP